MLLCQLDPGPSPCCSACLCVGSAPVTKPWALWLALDMSLHMNLWKLQEDHVGGGAQRTLGSHALGATSVRVGWRDPLAQEGGRPP